MCLINVFNFSFQKPATRGFYTVVESKKKEERKGMALQKENIFVQIHMRCHPFYQQRLMFKKDNRRGRNDNV